MPRLDKAASAYRRGKAVALRLAGCPYDAIAVELGFASRGHAYDAVQDGLAAAAAEPARALRRLEVGRLDALTDAIWEKAIGGDLDALDRILKVMARRAAMLGLDAPTKLAVRQDDRPPRRLAIPGAPPRAEADDDAEGSGPDDAG